MLLTLKKILRIQKPSSSEEERRKKERRKKERKKKKKEKMKALGVVLSYSGIPPSTFPSVCQYSQNVTFFLPRPLKRPIQNPKYVPIRKV